MILKCQAVVFRYSLQVQDVSFASLLALALRALRAALCPSKTSPIEAANAHASSLAGEGDFANFFC